MGSNARPLPAGRGRGRPVGADSAETRARILRAAREVINERGYEAANFAAIASRAGLSRPTMHYYFHTREEIYDCLVAEAYSIVSDCIAQAKREDTLLNQLSAFVDYLEQVAASDGAELIDDMVTSVECGERGVERLHLKSGQPASADLFVDCSGFGENDDL